MRECLGRAGCTLCAMNKVKEAKEHFEAAIRIMPNHLEVRIAKYHPCWGVYTALQNLHSLVASRIPLPGSSLRGQASHGCPLVQALFNLANLQRQCGEFEAAVASYERVLALSPDSWRGLLNYSVALVGLGRELEAKTALRRAFRLSGALLAAYPRSLLFRKSASSAA